MSTEEKAYERSRKQLVLSPLDADIGSLRKFMERKLDMDKDVIDILAVSYTHLTLPTIYSV